MDEVMVNNLEGLKDFAKTFCNKIKPGNVICMQGNLGAGKTTLVKYICEELQMNQQVQSPTFNILLQYKNGNDLIVNHFDLYRLNSEDDLEDIGFFEEIEADSINFIEWAEKFKNLMPENAIWLTIEKLDETSRKICYNSNLL